MMFKLMAFLKILPSELSRAMVTTEGPFISIWLGSQYGTCIYDYEDSQTQSFMSDKVFSPSKRVRTN